MDNIRNDYYPSSGDTDILDMIVSERHAPHYLVWSRLPTKNSMGFRLKLTLLFHLGEEKLLSNLLGYGLCLLIRDRISLHPAGLLLFLTLEIAPEYQQLRVTYINYTQRPRFLGAGVFRIAH